MAASVSRNGVVPKDTAAGVNKLKLNQRAQISSGLAKKAPKRLRLRSNRHCEASLARANQDGDGDRKPDAACHIIAGVQRGTPAGEVPITRMADRRSQTR
jgi:hypothetical protein